MDFAAIELDLLLIALLSSAKRTFIGGGLCWI